MAGGGQIKDLIYNFSEFFSSSSTQMNSADMLRSNQPIVHLRTRLSEEMFGTTETNSSTNTKQWYSYYRSSIADKMSDYEDIWDKSTETTRCLSPAESEIQFKAYLATKLSEEADPDPFHMPSSNSDSEEPKSSSTTGNFCDN